LGKRFPIAIGGPAPALLHEALERQFLARFVQFRSECLHDRVFCCSRFLGVLTQRLYSI